MMATTMLTGFQQLRQNLEISTMQAAAVSTRQTNLRNAVRAELTVVDDFLTGSYVRSTMIAPLKDADVDIFVVLDPSYYSAGGQATLLDRVKRVLQRSYPTTSEISRDGQAVTITFSDFRVDVVPAFNRQGGAYIIPNTKRGLWIETDPRKHVQIWADRNKAYGGSLVPLLKMIKAWNKANGSYLRSFYLETLVLQALQWHTFTSFPAAIRAFFDAARSIAGQSLYDPAGLSLIGGLSDADQKEARSRLETAYTRMVNADAAAARGNLSDAFYYWRLVFGDYFPAYG